MLVGRAYLRGIRQHIETSDSLRHKLELAQKKMAATVRQQQKLKQKIVQLAQWAARVEQRTEGGEHVEGEGEGTRYQIV
eukprot:COSAG02_NODE_767_length_17377_cov_991.347436_2_plen_79_part_00